MSILWVIVILGVFLLLLLYGMEALIKQSLSEFKEELINELHRQDLISKSETVSISNENVSGNTSSVTGNVDMNFKSTE